MMDAQNDSLFPFLHDYLKIYLPKHRKASVNTVRSYRKSLEALLDYAKAQLQLPLGSITFEHLTVDLILSFMEQLKLDTDCAASTYNTRLAAIRAFMDYAAERDIALAATLEKLKKISFEKPVNSHIVDFMSMEAVMAIVEQTDASTAKGLRDRVLSSCCMTPGPGYRRCWTSDCAISSLAIRRKSHSTAKEERQGLSH